MARTSQAPAPATAPEPKAPDFIAWHVSNRGDKAFWTKVGAAWFHRDRKGVSLTVGSLGAEPGTGFAPSSDFVNPPGKLSRWIAISGAAASTGSSAR